jgi:hypothetical protein
MSENAVEPTPVADPLWEADGYALKDRSGYTVEAYNLDTPGASPYFVVHREEDGTGIGAYGNDKAVDDAIATDREWVASNQPRTGGEDPGAVTVTQNTPSAPATPSAPDTVQVSGRRLSR